MNRCAPSLEGTRRSLGFALFVAALGLAVTAPAGAATITVGPSCTLANAINSANANADTGGCTHSGAYGVDTIILPFGTYALTAADNSGVIEGDSPIILAAASGEPRVPNPGGNSNGLPVVTSDITIMGNGSTIIRSLGASPPFFRIFQVSTNGVLTLNDLTLTGGELQDPGGTVQGGAVRVGSNGRLTLNTVTLSNNVVDASAAGAGGQATGGAVHVGESAQIRVIDAVIKNNSALATGSGSDASGGTAQGGGIFVESDAADVSVTGTTLTGNAVAANAGSGAVGGSGGVADGAGIFVTSRRNLTLFNVNVSSNTATALGGDSSTPTASSGGSGGEASGVGVHYESSSSGNLTVTNAVISFHTATVSGGNGGTFSGDGGLVSGGGVSFESGGTLSITDASINHNTGIARGGNGTASRGFGGFVEGGGVYFTGQSLTLNRVSISNNSANVVAGNGPGANGGLIEGAGLDVSQGSADPINAILDSVTLANNSGDASSGGGAGGHPGTAQGGGLYTEDSGTVTLVNCTISGNSLVPAAASDGGGIHQDSDTVTVRLQNSILTGNTADSSPDCDAAGNITSLGNNIVGSTQGCNFTAAVSDRFGLSPAFGAFTDSGGPASGFFPLNPGSPAVDAANSAACPAFDQLGQGRAGGCDIGAIEIVPGTALVASILPISRAGQVGGTSLTAFVSVINLGGTSAFKVGIAPASTIPATFHFQTTDPATNGLTGTPDTGADIGPGQVQTYVIAIRPTAAFDPIQIQFSFAGPNTAAVAPITGLNTLLASASVTPIADVVALAATINNNGIVDVAGPTGNGVFTVATVNLGAGGLIKVRPDTGATSPAPFVFVCQTNPLTAVCLSSPTPTVQTTIGTNETPTFALFVVGNGTIAFNPAVNRISVFFDDAGGITRGATGVAVRTTP